MSTEILSKHINDVVPVSNSSVTWLSRHRPSVAFVCCIGAGPWRIGRRMKVQQSFINALGEEDLRSKSALRRLTKASQLAWQATWFKRVNEVCNKYDMDFDSIFNQDFQKSLNAHNFEAVMKLEVDKSPKVVALFARDYLFIPCFPVDRHVRKWLIDRGLPHKASAVSALFKELKLNPSGYSRAIFNSKARNPEFTPTRRQS